MKISGILETCLYAKDLETVKSFYADLPGLEFISEEKGRHLFFRCGSSMLLIFNPEHTSEEKTRVNGQDIPLHGSEGSGHIAFSVKSADLNKWKKLLVLKKNLYRVRSHMA